VVAVAGAVALDPTAWGFLGQSDLAVSLQIWPYLANTLRLPPQ